jgi:hypothetical protein
VCNLYLAYAANMVRSNGHSSHLTYFLPSLKRLGGRRRGGKGGGGTRPLKTQSCVYNFPFQLFKHLVEFTKLGVTNMQLDDTPTPCVFISYNQ